MMAYNGGKRVFPMPSSSASPAAVSATPALPWKGVLLVLVAVAIWSGWMVISRAGVTGTLTAWDISAIRFGVAGTVLLPVIWKKGFRAGPMGWMGAVIMALLMGATYNTIAISGMRFAPTSHAGTVINGTMLIMTTSLGIWFLKEPTSRSRLAGVALTMGGLALMLLTALEEGYGVTVIKGHLYFAVAGCMWGLYVVLMKRWKVEPLHATACICVVSMLAFLPFYLAFIPSHIGLHNLGEVAFQAVYQGLINSIVALLCFNKGLEYLGAMRAGAFIPLVPVGAALLAIPALGEVPLPLEWAAIALVAAGVGFSSGMAEGVLARRNRRAELEATAEGL